MTPRAKKYFSRKRSFKYQESIFAAAIPILEAYHLCFEICKKLSQPAAKHKCQGISASVNSCDANMPFIKGEFNNAFVIDIDDQKDKLDGLGHAARILKK